MKILNVQYDMRPAIPHVYGNIDYKNFRETLIKLDEILCKGQLEDQLVSAAIDQWTISAEKPSAEFMNTNVYSKLWRQHQFALRCNIARHLTGESFRQFSVRLSDSALFQWFTRIHYFTNKKAISKSSLDRFSKMFDESMIAEILLEWQASFLTTPNKTEEIGLNEAMSFRDTFLDSTCIKANIHFPVDWVLLRDAARSLLSAMKTIRAQGLKHRMIEPVDLMKQMNRLCIAMTHTRRKKDSKKQRKKILRAMKKLSHCIQKHAERYCALLIKNREKTHWSEAQSNLVLDRINNILNQLPAAIKQAHDRIIGERKTASKEKILSLYDPDVHVIVRGKSEGEVEFGQGLMLAEQRDGLIVDWCLFKDQPKSDSGIFMPLMKRIQRYYGVIASSTGDRGFDSEANRDFLEQENIYNGLCPRSPKKLQERINDPRFLELQTRRSQTEGRIGIFKNIFLGKPLKSKRFFHRQTTVAWCVLTHNLWVIARKALSDEKIRLKQIAYA